MVGASARICFTEPIIPQVLTAHTLESESDYSTWQSYGSIEWVSSALDKYIHLEGIERCCFTKAGWFVCGIARSSRNSIMNIDTLSLRSRCSFQHERMDFLSQLYHP